MGSFLSKPRGKRVVIELPHAIAWGADFEILVTDDAYDKMAVTIKQDDETVMIITREGEIVKHGRYTYCNECDRWSPDSNWKVEDEYDGDDWVSSHVNCPLCGYGHPEHDPRSENRPGGPSG